MSTPDILPDAAQLRGTRLAAEAAKRGLTPQQLIEGLALVVPESLVPELARELMKPVVNPEGAQ